MLALSLNELTNSQMTGYSNNTASDAVKTWNSMRLVLLGSLRVKGGMTDGADQPACQRSPGF